MGLHFKTAAGLLLLVHFFHLASFQNSTSPPVITIDRNWLRELVRNESASPNSPLGEIGLDYDERGQPPAESGSSGIPSGAMAIIPEEDEILTEQGSGEEGNMFTVVPVDVASEPPDSNMSSFSNASGGASESNQTNITETTSIPDNPATTPRNDSGDLSVQNVTIAEDLSNHTDSTTASPPQGNVTDETTPTAAKDWNTTDHSASTVADVPPVTTAGSHSTADQTDSTTVAPTTSLKASTVVDTNTPQGANNTGKVAAEGSSSDRGMTASSHSGTSDLTFKHF